MRNLTQLGKALTLIMALFISLGLWLGIFALVNAAQGQTVITGIPNPQGITRKCGGSFYIANAQGKGTFSSGGIFKYDPSTGAVSSLVNGFNVIGKVDCLSGNTGIIFDSPYGQIWRHDLGTSTATLLASFAGNHIPAWQVANMGPGSAAVGMMGSQRVWGFSTTSPSVPIALAGNGNYTTQGGDGPALTIPLGQPGGAAYGPDQLLYFGEQAGGHIRRVNANGDIETLSGTGYGGWCDPGTMTFGDCPWRAPTDLAFDDNGSLYVLDSLHYAQFRILDVANKGRSAKVEIAGIFANLGKPGGQAIDGSSRYVSFPDGGAVVRFDDGPTPTPMPWTPSPQTPTPTLTQTPPPTSTPVVIPSTSTPTRSAVATSTPTTAGIPFCPVPCKAPSGSVLQ